MAHLHTYRGANYVPRHLLWRLALTPQLPGAVACRQATKDHYSERPHPFLAQRLRSIKIAIRQETVRINSTIVATSAEDTRGSTPSPNRDLDKIPVARRAI
jgi:hypothetical protein